jgi:hypothetical protein
MVIGIIVGLAYFVIAAVFTLRRKNRIKGKIVPILLFGPFFYLLGEYMKGRDGIRKREVFWFVLMVILMLIGIFCKF